MEAPHTAHKPLITAGCGQGSIEAIARGFSEKVDIRMIPPEGAVIVTVSGVGGR